MRFAEIIDLFDLEESLLLILAYIINQSKKKQNESDILNNNECEEC